MTADKIAKLQKELTETKQALAKSQAQLAMVKTTVKAIIGELKQQV